MYNYIIKAWFACYSFSSCSFFIIGFTICLLILIHLSIHLSIHISTLDVSWSFCPFYLYPSIFYLFSLFIYIFLFFMNIYFSIYLLSLHLSIHISTLICPLKLLSQTLHWNIFFPSWKLSMCLFRVSARGYDFSHKWHWKSLKIRKYSKF